MNFGNKGINPVLTAALLSCLSCDVEFLSKKPVDSEKPNIELINTFDEGYVRGVIDLKARVVDNEEIAAIKVLVDGVLIQEVTLAPVEVRWDTETVSDGIHSIEVQATDKAGNKNALAFEVNVLNYYLEFTVQENDYVFKNIDSWIFISSTDGEVLSVGEITNGEILRLKTPEKFSLADSLVVNVLNVFHRPEENDDFMKIRTFTGCSTGKYLLKNERVWSSVEMEMHYLRIHNADDYYQFRASGRNVLVGGVSDFRNKTVSTEIIMWGDSSDLFAALQVNKDEPPKYILIPNIKPDSTTDVSIFEMKEMTREGSALGASVAAVPSPGDYRNAYIIWEYYKDSPSPYYFPNDLFPEYIFSSTTLGHRDKSTYTSISKRPPEQSRFVNAVLTDFKFSNAKLAFQTEGSFDYVAMIANVSNFGKSTVWEVHLGANSRQVMLPEIPAELKTKYGIPQTRAFKFSEVLFTELTGEDNYQDFLDMQFHSNEYFIQRFKEYSEKWIYL